MNRCVAGIRSDTRRLSDGMFNIAHILNGSASHVGDLVELLNRRLLVRVAEVLGLWIPASALKRIARDPGLRTKLLWEDGVDFLGVCRDVGLAIDEWVDGVPDGPMEVCVAVALQPANVPASMVSISDNMAVVRLPTSEVGRAIGKDGSNVALASRLVQLRIKILDEKALAQGEEHAQFKEL